MKPSEEIKEEEIKEIKEEKKMNFGEIVLSILLAPIMILFTLITLLVVGIYLIFSHKRYKKVKKPGSSRRIKEMRTKE